MGRGRDGGIFFFISELRKAAASVERACKMKVKGCLMCCGAEVGGRAQDGDVALQVLQVQSVMEGHEVRVAGDPPEGHVVLRTEQKHRFRTQQACSFIDGLLSQNIIY